MRQSAGPGAADRGHGTGVRVSPHRHPESSHPTHPCCRIARSSIDVLVQARAPVLSSRAQGPPPLASRCSRPVFTLLETPSMKCLMLIKHSESYRAESIPQALMDAMGDFVNEGLKSGVLKDTAGLKSTAEGFRVRSSGNQLKVTDGPFTESKEVVGGYALVEVASKEEALQVGR